MKRSDMICMEVLLAPEGVEAFEELISLYELDGVEIVNPFDPMYGDSLWAEEERPPQPIEEPLARLYGEEEVIQEVLENLSELILSSREVPIIEEDWMRKWAESFEGIEAGERLFIHPPWRESHEERLNVCVVPGMAFGTGSHETTRLSAQAIERWMRPGDRVIDVGSGSGVLSLCAAALGAKSVLAVENDPMTFSNAQENFSLNPFSSVIELTEGDLLSGVDRQADVIVANILPHILAEMAPQTLVRLKRGGKVILSGILSERVPEVLEAYREHYVLREETKMGEWSALVLERVK